MPDAGILRVCLFYFMTPGFRYAHDGGAPGGVLMALWLAWMVVLVYFFCGWQARFIFEIPFPGILMLAASMTDAESPPLNHDEEKN